jgi:hypothetical protein
MKVTMGRCAYALALLMLMGYAYIALLGSRGLPALFARKAQIRQAEERNADLMKQIERKREHIRRLESNPAEQELEIQERLKLVRPNQRIFITGAPEKR